MTKSAVVHEDAVYGRIEDINTRLRRSIVAYDGKPVYVDTAEVHEDGIPRLYIRATWPVSEDKAVRKAINSPLFNNFRPLKLGWVNLFSNGYNHASYITQKGVRRSKQGLSSENISSLDINKNPGMGFSRLIESDGKALAEAFANIYPRLENLLGKIAKDASVGISTDFCLYRDISGFHWLYNKMDRVGLFFRGEFYLDQAHEYLKEQLQETFPKDPFFKARNIKIGW